MLHLLSLVLSILCFSTYLGYCKVYEKEYGIFTSSISFICNDIYNLQRSAAWNTDKVSNTETRFFLDSIANNVNYAPVYNAISTNHKMLPMIVQGCKEIKAGSEKALRRHQIEITAASFDKRFNASVNTHTPLSAILFTCSLFLTLPLSLFYGITIIACIALVVYFLRNRTIPLMATVIILFTAAQCSGILLYASEAHERLLLPVYPLSLVLLGVTIEKTLHFINNN